MNFGKTIAELRKNKNVTQEEIAAELGVTAAAVSKWENGYTLPDILMLCTLADYFQVTTDALLGRNPVPEQAIIVADTEELGQKIADLAKKYGIEPAVILTDYETALAVAQYEAEHKNQVKYLFNATSHPLAEEEMDDTLSIHRVNASTSDKTDEAFISAFELYLENKDVFLNFVTK